MAITSSQNIVQDSNRVGQYTYTNTTTYNTTGGTTDLPIDNGTSMQHIRNMGVTIAGDTLSHSDSTTLLQGSMDGTGWVAIGAAATLDGADAVVSHTDENTPFLRFRIKWTQVSVTSGTLTLTAVFKQ